MSLAVQTNGFPLFDDEVFAVLALDAALVAMSVLIYTQPASAQPVYPITSDLPPAQVENVTVVPDSIVQETILESSIAAGLGESLTVDCLSYTQYLSREDCSVGNGIFFDPPDTAPAIQINGGSLSCDRPNHLETSVLSVCLPFQ